MKVILEMSEKKIKIVEYYFQRRCGKKKRIKKVIEYCVNKMIKEEAEKELKELEKCTGL